MDNTKSHKHKNIIRTAIYSNKKIIAAITTSKKPADYHKETVKAV